MNRTSPSECLACAAVLLIACGGDQGELTPDSGKPALNAESLAALELFADPVAQTPNDGVLPYEVNAVLYADEAEKLRFLNLPKHEAAAYDAMDSWQFPD